MNIDLNPEVVAKAIVLEVERKHKAGAAENKRLTDFVIATLKGHSTDPAARKPDLTVKAPVPAPVPLKVHEPVKENS